MNYTPLIFRPPAHSRLSVLVRNQRRRSGRVAALPAALFFRQGPRAWAAQRRTGEAIRRAGRETGSRFTMGGCRVRVASFRIPARWSDRGGMHHLPQRRVASKFRNDPRGRTSGMGRMARYATLYVCRSFGFEKGNDAGLLLFLCGLASMRAIGERQADIREVTCGLRRSGILSRYTSLRPSPLRRRSVKKRSADAAWKLVTSKRGFVVGFRCEVGLPGCLMGLNCAGHHRLARSQGGKHELSNCLYVCSACHNWIHANPAVSYERGWMVRKGAA